MITKEIEVWVRKEIFEAKENGAFKDLVCLSYPQDAERNCLKARLIVELPEKEIEITESQFDKIFYDHPTDMIDLDQVKQKLFGKEEGK